MYLLFAVVDPNIPEVHLITYVSLLKNIVAIERERERDGTPTTLLLVINASYAPFIIGREKIQLAKCMGRCNQCGYTPYVL